MGFLQSFCTTFFISSALLYVLFSTLFSYSYIQNCSGDWGITSPPLKEKTGMGTCSVSFDLTFVPFLKQETGIDGVHLISWETKYVGQWKEGKKHGKGEFVSFSGNRYVGEWFQDKRHGEGSFFLADGTIYQGRWEQDSFVGKENHLQLSMRKSKYPGEAIYFNQTLYEGNVSGGVMDGMGVLFLGNSSHRIEGTFSSGLMQFAKIYLANGAVFQTLEFESSFDWGYNVNGSLVESGDSQTQLFSEDVILWDGEKIVVQSKEGSDKILISPTDFTSQCYPSNGDSSIQELFYVLHSLKAIETHFIFSKNFLQSEPYTFEYVDRSSSL